MNHPHQPVAQQEKKLPESLVDWSLCLFCQKGKSHGETRLFKLCTTEAEKKIRNAAENLQDEVMKRKIAFLDLIAQEAKYNKTVVELTYRRLQDAKGTKTKEETVYEKAFSSFILSIEDKLFKDLRALKMTQLLEEYKAILSENGLSEGEACKYRTEKLKQRLIKYFGTSIVFHKLPDPS